MEQLSNLLVELNRSNHTGFAILTVLTMVGLGGFIAGVIELIFSLIGIKADKQELIGTGEEKLRETPIPVRKGE
jgi:hypothetical protein